MLEMKKSLLSKFANSKIRRNPQFKGSMLKVWFIDAFGLYKTLQFTSLRKDDFRSFKKEMRYRLFKQGVKLIIYIKVKNYK